MPCYLLIPARYSIYSVITSILLAMKNLNKIVFMIQRIFLSAMIDGHYYLSLRQRNDAAIFDAIVNVLFICTRMYVYVQHSVCTIGRTVQVKTNHIRVNSWLFFPRELVIKSFITDHSAIKLQATVG